MLKTNTQDNPEAVRGTRQRDAAHIHTQQTSHLVDGKRQHHHDRKYKNTAVGCLGGVGAEFLLKQFGQVLKCGSGQQTTFMWPTGQLKEP